jgi:hypothetical protein|nr:MAG TPA: hypothetical protein [Caudoviricetes sp.]
MDKESILNKVYTKTYYIGEALKKNNTHDSIVQACKDNSDILLDYFEAALNEINFYAQKKLFKVIVTDKSIEIISERAKKEEISKSLDSLVSDYLVEYISFRWLFDNGYGISPEGVLNALENVKDCICALAPKVRRRAANMGI